MLLDYLVFFGTSECFILLKVIFLLKFFSLLSKSLSCTKPACFNLIVRFSVVNLLNSWVVIYLELSIIWYSTLLILHSKQLQSLNHLYLVVLHQHLQFISLSFVYLCCTDLCKLKQLSQEFSFLNYLLLPLACWIFCY